RRGAARGGVGSAWRRARRRRDRPPLRGRHAPLLARHLRPGAEAAPRRRPRPRGRRWYVRAVVVTRPPSGGLRTGEMCVTTDTAVSRRGLFLLALALCAAVAAPSAGAAGPRRPPVTQFRGDGSYTKASRGLHSIRYIVIHATDG